MVSAHCGVSSWKKALKVILMLHLTWLLAACQDDVGNGGICERCNSEDDCNEGLSCRGFYNSTLITERCATLSTRSCDV